MAQVEPNKRNWVRKNVDFTVRLIFPTSGIRNVHSATFKLQDMSEGGASLYVGGIKCVPDFFYMQFGDERSELVCCYLVKRDHDILRCEFSQIMPTEKVDEIIAQKGMTSLLDSLFEPSKDELVIDLAGLL